MVQIKSYGGSQVAAPQRVSGVEAGQSAIGEGLGGGLQQVGATLYDWQDEADTASAKIADAKYSDLIREELYANETGFMYATGANAMSRREGVSQRLKEAQDAVMANLTPAARYRAENAINARYQGALQTVDQHSSGQARTYINEASAARQQAFINDAIANPDSTGFQVQQITREIMDDAARNGLSPEVTQLRIQEAVTGIHAPVIERLANVDPLAALEYLGMHGGEMDPAVVARLEGALAPAAKRERGRQIGAQVS
ncbi:MAG: hypothetical protein ACRC0L_06040, partial [Angustibacter sp.]